MVQRYDVHDKFEERLLNKTNGRYVEYEDYQELEAENAKLRQQRDAANAQLDFLIEQTGVKRVLRSNMDECD